MSDDYTKEEKEIKLLIKRSIVKVQKRLHTKNHKPLLRPLSMSLYEHI